MQNDSCTGRRIRTERRIGVSPCRGVGTMDRRSTAGGVGWFNGRAIAAIIEHPVEAEVQRLIADRGARYERAFC